MDDKIVLIEEEAAKIFRNIEYLNQTDSVARASISAVSVRPANNAQETAEILAVDIDECAEESNQVCSRTIPDQNSEGSFSQQSAHNEWPSETKQSHLDTIYQEAYRLPSQWDENMSVVPRSGSVHFALENLDREDAVEIPFTQMQELESGVEKAKSQRAQHVLNAFASQRFQTVSKNAVTENEHRIQELDRRIKVYVIDAFDSQKRTIQLLMEEKRQTLTQMAFSLLGSGNFRKAIDIFRRLTFLFELSHTDTAAIGQCFYALEAYETAFLLFCDATLLSKGEVDLSDRCADCFHVLSEIANSNGHTEQSGKYLQMAVEISPANLIYRLKLIKQQVCQKNFQEAVFSIGDVVRLTQNDQTLTSDLLYQQALLFKKIGLLPEMYASLNKALDNNPDNQDAKSFRNYLSETLHNLLQDARKLFAVHRYHAAWEKLRELIHHNPHHFESLLIMSKILRKQNDFRSAVNLLESILGDLSSGIVDIDANKLESVLYETVLLLNDWGVALIIARNAGYAAEIFEAAVKIIKDCNVTGNAGFAVFENCGMAMEVLGNVLAAKAFYEMACESLERQITPCSDVDFVDHRWGGIRDKIKRVETKFTRRSRLQQQQWRRSSSEVNLNRIRTTNAMAITPCRQSN